MDQPDLENSATLRPKEARRYEKSKFTEEQIAFALKQAETGTTVCRKMGISQATFYAWRKKFDWLGVAEEKNSA